MTVNISNILYLLPVGIYRLNSKQAAVRLFDSLCKTRIYTTAKAICHVIQRISSHV